MRRVWLMSYRGRVFIFIVTIGLRVISDLIQDLSFPCFIAFKAVLLRRIETEFGVIPYLIRDPVVCIDPGSRSGVTDEMTR